MLDLRTPNQKRRDAVTRRRASRELEEIITRTDPPTEGRRSHYGLAADVLEAYAQCLAHADDPAVALRSGYRRAQPVRWLPWEINARFGMEAAA